MKPNDTKERGREAEQNRQRDRVESRPGRRPAGYMAAECVAQDPRHVQSEPGGDRRHQGWGWTDAGLSGRSTSGGGGRGGCRPCSGLGGTQPRHRLKLLPRAVPGSRHGARRGTRKQNICGRRSSQWRAMAMVPKGCRLAGTTLNRRGGEEKGERAPPKRD